MRKRKKNRLSETSKNTLTSAWGIWFASKRPVFYFGLKFVFLMAVFYGLYFRFLDSPIWISFLEFNARVANTILNLLGQESQVSGIQISSSRFTMTIQQGCEAMEPTALLVAAMLSYPASFVHKAGGIVVGVILLQMLNLTRIVSLHLVGSYYPALFTTAHEEIWPALFILSGVFLMVFWIKIITAVDGPKSKL